MRTCVRLSEGRIGLLERVFANQSRTIPSIDVTSCSDAQAYPILSMTWRFTNVAEPWLSAEEIAAHLGATKDTVYSWISRRAMPGHRVGRLWRFQVSEVDEWVRRGGGPQAPGAESPKAGWPE